MRNALTTMVGMAFLGMAACSNPQTSDGGSSTGGLPDASLKGLGDACGGNNQCESNICGINGTGHCCQSLCNVGAPGDICATPSDCNDGGQCIYPPLGTNCGTACASDMLTTKTCDGAGGCSNPKSTPCPGNFGCGATACNASCTLDAGGCATNYYCDNGACAQSIDTGPCGDNTVCSSGLCAPNHYCCRENCPHDKNPECVAFACTADAGGSCVYPSTGTVCDVANESCSGSTLSAGQCDGMGTCDPASVPCPNGFACGSVAGSGCNTACGTDSNCATGYYCGQNGVNRGKCVAQIADGGCTNADQCLSNVCGASGTGNCCLAQCVTGDAVCGATGCDGTTEACDYPKAGTACGGQNEIALACALVKGQYVQTNPTLCDGIGTCDLMPNPAITPCGPYVCNGNGTGAAGTGAACFTTCKDDTACITGDFCDTTGTSCCGAIGGAIKVDSMQGKDAPCCGFGTIGPCQTIGYAMKLIDASKTTGVIINASVGGNNGDWAVAGEVYPIVLGWGVELFAPGVAFEDPNSVGANPVVSKAIFDIKLYSANDTAGSASLYGTALNPVTVGMNSKLNTQSGDTTGILVEGGNKLYLAAANVNGNTQTAAITVQPNGSLVLGTDASTKNVGTVTIGTKQGNLSGGTGILCGAAGATKACTITDSSPGANTSGVVIENQVSYDIDAEDLASITLNANPVIGLAPKKTGFTQCGPKTDASSPVPNLAAILLHGSATMTFDNGTVQCIAAPAFRLLASASATPPSLTVGVTGMGISTIQNTELGIFASAGTATVTSTTIQFNYNGVEQKTDAASNSGTIDLSGGGNTVVCSSEKESVVPAQTTPGVCVLNETSNQLKADKTAWDTTGPDQFSCNVALAMCTCESGGCTNTAGADDMDAVYTGTGTISTTLNTQSPIATTYNCN